MGIQHANRHLAGINLSSVSQDECVSMLRKILDSGIHGIAFSPYLDGQGPGDQISEAQIEQRLSIIEAYTHWIRTFSCVEGNEKIPHIAKAHNLNTMVGICLSDDKDKNEIELNNGIEIARNGYADILAVGNEVLLRGELTVQELIEYISRAKRSVPDLDVSYVDAYFQFEDHPELAEACDLLLVNCYPFWEECPADYALLYMKDMYQRAVKAAKGKEVIISETGWPSSGAACGAAVPSLENAMQYFINTYVWARQEGIKIFYFSSFDEAWKTGDEGDVGAYWGLWDKEGSFKYA
ncbi:MAG: glycosyl hydrolase [Gammaproteobacteria bacterium]|nr:glycosyl hydrolase [Gammaproteobacteria bacterium]